MLILYPAILPKEFMIYCILVEFWGSLMYRLILSAKRNSLTSSFLIWVNFIPFSCLIALVRNTKTIFNRSRESSQPCLIPDFKANGFSCSSFSMMLALGLSYIAFVVFVVLRNIPSIPSSFRVLSWKGVGLCPWLFLHWEDNVFFVPASPYMLYYVYAFTYIELSLHPWNETDLVML
jgi:hypothetical protein